MPFHNVGTQCTIVFIACQLDLSSLCNIYGSETAATHIILSLSLYIMLTLPRRACWVILLTSSSQARNIHKHSALENCARSCTKTQTSSKTQFSRSLQTNYASRLGLGADVSRLVGQRETLEFRGTGSDCKRKSHQQTNKQRCIYTRAMARRV